MQPTITYFIVRVVVDCPDDGVNDSRRHINHLQVFCQDVDGLESGKLDLIVFDVARVKEFDDRRYQ